jgi:spore germination cell wall hydrolase CwlJ-like protein
MEKTMKTVALVLVAGVMGFIACSVTQYKMDSLRNKETGPEHMSAAEVEKNLNCLALNIYREAGNEPFEGKVAVAQVTLNRSESGHFPKEICAVVYQKGRNPFTDKIVCQFSWYCDVKHRNRPVDDKTYEESYRVAKMVFVENFRLESVKDALFYHADYVNPRWNKKRIVKIGTHIFYEG